MKKFQQLLQAQFDKMCATGKLFTVSLTGDQIWDIYINSFIDDPIFRDPNSTSHTCNNCKNFIRRYGNIVALDENNNIMTMFDVRATNEFIPVAKALRKAIIRANITNVFFETFNELNSLPYEVCKKTNSKFRLGLALNHKRYTTAEAEKFMAAGNVYIVEPDQIMEFNHMHLDIPAQFVDMTGASQEAIIAGYRDAKEVFKRGMETISLDTLKLVKDLINQGSLLDGTTHLHKIEKFIPFKQEFDALSGDIKDNWCWNQSYGLKIAKFRNELIGVLCVELSEGKELNEACKAWNKRVDPANYMKAKAPITQRQIDEAKKYVEENGYEESFDRRFATIEDIKVSEILHSNVGDGKIKSVSVFDGMKATSSRHKRNEFDGVEEVHIDKFMKDILPSCTSIEAFLKNSYVGNMVSLTTAKDPSSKRIFRWDNNYSWTYNGNLAGRSMIKDAIKDAGGNVEGVLNFRLAWNDAGQNDNSDLDLWAQEPNYTQIGYSADFRKDRGNNRSSMSGQLDVDNTNPDGKLAVENITWTDKSKMKDGVYKIWVNQFSARNSKGFKVEIEFDGNTYSYEYNKPLGYQENVKVAEVTLSKGEFTIKHLLPESELSSKEIYGLESNSFHKVNLVCLSPNHWDGNNAGNKHYFFMLEGAKTPTSIRSFHNENLIPELLDHRKVMEVLGTNSMIEPTGKQLSGLGFNSTIKDELIVKLSGNFKRVIKIKFN